MNDHGRKTHEPLNPDSSDDWGDVECEPETLALSPEAEALSKSLRAKFCGWDCVYEPSDMPQWEIFRTIVEELGITEETVKALRHAVYIRRHNDQISGYLERISQQADGIEALLELANHGE